MLDRELRMGSMIRLNSSALAVGVEANGDMPKAKNALALAPIPTTRRRRAWALRDR
jgi:hypothetical protein